MNCPHASASVHSAMMVQRGEEKWLRSFCHECRNYVDTLPVLGHSGNVVATEWIPTGFVIPEHEIDPKETTRHV